MARFLHLVRHGATAENLQGIFIGRTDVGLSPEGEEESDSLKQVVKGIEPDHFLTSPLKRCRQTAQRLTGGLNDWTEHPALAEIDFGDWEGLGFGEIAEKHPMETRAWSRLDEDFCFPGGESLKSFKARMTQLVDDLVALEGDVVLAVTHGGVIRHLVCHLLNLPTKSYLYLQVGTASLSALELHEHKGVLLQLNWKPQPVVFR